MIFRKFNKQIYCKTHNLDNDLYNIYILKDEYEFPQYILLNKNDNRYHYSMYLIPMSKKIVSSDQLKNISYIHIINYNNLCVDYCIVPKQHNFIKVIFNKIKFLFINVKCFFCNKISKKELQKIDFFNVSQYSQKNK